MAERAIEHAYAFYGNKKDLNGKNKSERTKILRGSSEVIEPADFTIEYRDSLYCLGCTDKVTRKPLKENTTKNKKPAYFSHLRRDNPVFCPYRVSASNGRNYQKEEITSQFADNDNLIVFNKWSSVHHEELEPKEGPKYHGPDHNPWGEDIDQPLARHYGERIGIANRLSSVRTIAHNLDQYMMAAVTFPGEEGARIIKDILVPIRGDKAPDPNTKTRFLYHGVISSVNQGPYRVFLNLDTDNGQYSFYVDPEIYESRKFKKGRVVLAYALLTGDHMYIDELGQIDMVPDDMIKYLGY